MAPNGLSQIEKQERQDRMVAAREAGQSLKDIGRTYGLSIEGVRQILLRTRRKDLCPGQGVWLGKRPCTDKWFRNKSRIQADLRVQRILALRRQEKSWAEVGSIVFPQIDPRWSGLRCVKIVRYIGTRHNLDVRPAFYHLQKLKARQRAAERTD